MFLQGFSHDYRILELKETWRPGSVFWLYRWRNWNSDRINKLFVQGQFLVALKLESKYPEQQANRLSIVHLARPFYFLTRCFPICLYKIHKTTWGVLFILLHSKWLIETHNSHQCNLSDWTGVFPPSWTKRNKNESETQRVKETVQRYFLMVYALA